MAQLGRRAFGLTLFVMAVIGLVPGASTIVGLLVAWPAVQMVLGHDVAVLPRLIARREIGVDRLARVIRIVTPRLAWVERLIRPRWPPPFQTTKRLTGFVMLLLGLTMISPVPFSHVVPALVIMLLALRLYHKAIELDPNFAAAYGGAVRCYAQRRANGWMADPATEVADATRLARRAVALGRDDAGALALGGLGLALVARELDDGAAFVGQALRLNPNLATAWHISALIRSWLGEPEVAVEHEARAMRLSPLDPLIGQMQSGTAWAHFLADRYNDASSWAERAIRDMPNWFPAHVVAATSHGIAGRLDRAHEAMARLRQLNSTIRLSRFADFYPLRRPEDIARLREGLQKAGLTE